MLGVIEGNPVNTIQGVGNISKTQINLWDMLSNPNKINYRSVDNEDVHVVNIDGAEINGCMRKRGSRVDETCLF